jgi:Tol biopolymer transport system component
MRGTIERSPRWLPDEHHIVFVSKTWGGNVQRDGMYVVNVNDTLRPKLLNKVTANWIDWIDVIVPSLGMSPNSLTAVIWGQIKKSLSD